LFFYQKKDENVFFTTNLGSQINKNQVIVCTSRNEIISKLGHYLSEISTVLLYLILVFFELRGSGLNRVRISFEKKKTSTTLTSFKATARAAIALL